MAKLRVVTKLFSEQLRDAVRSSTKTRYRISQETGIAESTLSRFLNQGAGLSLDSIDKLAECLGLRLAVDPSHTDESKPRTRKGKQ